MIGVRLFGSKWVNIKRASRAPNVRDASTNSRPLKLKNSARTRRVTPIQEVNPITIITLMIEGVKNAMTAKIKKKLGIDSITSTKRMINVSTQPR